MNTETIVTAGPIQMNNEHDRIIAAVLRIRELGALNERLYKQIGDLGRQQGVIREEMARNSDEISRLAGFIKGETGHA